MKAPCQTITDFPVQFPDETRNFPVRRRREFSRKAYVILPIFCTIWLLPTGEIGKIPCIFPASRENTGRRQARAPSPSIADRRCEADERRKLRRVDEVEITAIGRGEFARLLCGVLGDSQRLNSCS